LQGGEEIMTKDDILLMARNAYGIYSFTAEDLSNFANLVMEDEREACAKVCDLVAREIDDTNGIATYAAKAIRKRGDVHAIDISQERVDETAKDRHEPVAWREVAGKTTHYYDYNEQGRGEPLYAAPQPDLARVGEVGVWGDKREWVGLDDDIPGLGLVTEEFYNGMLCAEDILRKRNT